MRMKIILLIAVLICLIFHTSAQSNNDTLGSATGNKNYLSSGDSTGNSIIKVTVPSVADKIAGNNKLINLANSSVSLISKEKQYEGKELLFYLLASLVLITAIFKVFYARYFNTVFRVYFNTSLRQNQLTEILVQAKLPSLIFNILFFITTSIYTWQVLSFYHWIGETLGFLLPFIILGIAVIYITKFIVIKFLGWLSGNREAANSYIFIIFLINKIVGILFIPFIILLAFSPIGWHSIIILLSFFCFGLAFLSRYIRSYDLLKNKLIVSRLHFILGILAFEILPILILSKSALKMLS